MTLKILPFPDICPTETRVHALMNSLMDDQDATEAILEKLLEYWSEIENPTYSEWLVYYHLQQALDLVTFQNLHEVEEN